MTYLTANQLGVKFRILGSHDNPNVRSYSAAQRNHTDRLFASLRIRSILREPSPTANTDPFSEEVSVVSVVRDIGLGIIRLLNVFAARWLTVVE